MIRSTLFLTLLLVVAGDLTAAGPSCVNKFMARRERHYQVVTLLTGNLTFQEAQKLSADIQARKSEPLSWVDEKGKPIARQFGELKVVRPMPVGCEGRGSGVVMTVTMVTVQPPSKKMFVRLGADSTVAFDEQ
jgi:hypothetical protein